MGARGSCPALLPPIKGRRDLASRFSTEDTCHLPPRADRIPRALSASAMPANVEMPVSRIPSMIGWPLAANRSASFVRQRHCTAARPLKNYPGNLHVGPREPF